MHQQHLWVAQHWAGNQIPAYSRGIPHKINMDKSNQCRIFCLVANAHSNSSQWILSWVSGDTKRPHVATKTGGLINARERPYTRSTHHSRATTMMQGNQCHHRRHAEHNVYWSDKKISLCFKPRQQVHYGPVWKRQQPNPCQTNLNMVIRGNV